MAKKDEIKVGDEVFAEQGFEDAEGQLHDVTAVVESIEDGVYKLKSEEFDLSASTFEEADLVKKPAKDTSSGSKNTTANTTAPKKKTVVVDEETLKKLVDGYEGLQQKVKDLEGAADVGRLQRIQAARMDGKLVKSAKVNTYEGKYVIAWSTVKDDVWFDEAGKQHEDQQVELFLYEGEGKTPSKTAPMSYRQFSRLTTKVAGEVIKESKESDGKVSFTVLLPDGLELELPIVFLN